jgi:hypothetical protein
MQLGYKTRDVLLFPLVVTFPGFAYGTLLKAASSHLPLLKREREFCYINIGMTT